MDALLKISQGSNIDYIMEIFLHDMEKLNILAQVLAFVACKYVG